MAQAKKVSTAAVYGKIPLTKLIAAHKEDKSLHIMTVVGIAVGELSGVSVHGEYHGLSGTFEGVNPEDGVSIKAAECYLPPVALTPILVALNIEGTKSVSFGIKLFAKYVGDDPTSKSPLPYVYEWEPLLPPTAESDPLERLKARMNAEMALLAAPKEGESASGADAASATPGASAAIKKARK